MCKHTAVILHAAHLTLSALVVLFCLYYMLLLYSTLSTNVESLQMTRQEAPSTVPPIRPWSGFNTMGLERAGILTRLHLRPPPCLVMPPCKM